MFVRNGPGNRASRFYDLFTGQRVPSIAPRKFSFNGSEGQALTGGDEVWLESWDGRQQHGPGLRAQAAGMDRAVAEIVAWLDGRTPFAYDAAEALHVPESIVAFHASHDRSGAWTKLPLSGEDRDRLLNSG